MNFQDGDTTVIRTLYFSIFLKSKWHCHFAQEIQKNFRYTPRKEIMPYLMIAVALCPIHFVTILTLQKETAPVCYISWITTILELIFDVFGSGSLKQTKSLDEILGYFSQVN